MAIKPRILRASENHTRNWPPGATYRCEFSTRNWIICLWCRIYSLLNLWAYLGCGFLSSNPPCIKVHQKSMETPFNSSLSSLIKLHGFRTVAFGMVQSRSMRGSIALLENLTTSKLAFYTKINACSYYMQSLFVFMHFPMRTPMTRQAECLKHPPRCNLLIICNIVIICWDT